MSFHWQLAASDFFTDYACSIISLKWYYVYWGTLEAMEKAVTKVLRPFWEPAEHVISLRWGRPLHKILFS
jgi:hypothetical protein